MIAVKEVFEGSKFFWRTRNSIDVMIVEHKVFDLFEVITYEPTLDKEGTRIYLTGSIVRTEIESEVNNKLSFAMRNDVPLTEKYVDGVTADIISGFVLQRVTLPFFSIEERQFEVCWKHMSTDVSVDLIVSCPDGLQPFQTKHNKFVMHEVVVEAMNELAEIKRSLQEASATAALAEVAVAETLSAKQRWRMPIVMSKVFNNKKLNLADTRIFRHVQGNMKSDDDVKRIYSTVMRTAKPISFSLMHPTSCPHSHPHSRPSSRPQSANTTPEATPRHRPACTKQPSFRRESSLLANTQSSMHRAAGAGNEGKSARTPRHHKRGSAGRHRRFKTSKRSHADSSDEAAGKVDDNSPGAVGNSFLDSVTDTITTITTSIKAAVSGKHRRQLSVSACAATSTSTDVGDVDGGVGCSALEHADDAHVLKPIGKSSFTPAASIYGMSMSVEEDEETAVDRRPKGLTTRRSLLGTVLQALTSTVEGALSWGTGASNNNNTRKVAVVG